ncbi:MAG TPA: hypothetical protein VFO40_28475, partial [Chthoniobacterales bacterium]|nr:hypothetical protein [Chthoniobacterales bacterium]
MEQRLMKPMDKRWWLVRFAAFGLSVAWLIGGAEKFFANDARDGAAATREDDDAQSVAAIREHYTKYEYRIVMRDGAKLFTAVYVPKDASPARTYPLLIERTPYSIGPYGPDNYPKHLGPA